MKAKRIYLAVPYSHCDEAVREERFLEVSSYANQLMREGYLVFSPITHGHILGLYGGLTGDFAFWQEHCLSFLRHWAQELRVLPLPGWNKSIGVLAEIAEAKRLGLVITGLDAEQNNGRKTQV